jgi:hypothetical protein
MLEHRFEWLEFSLLSRLLGNLIGSDLTRVGIRRGKKKPPVVSTGGC